jgi:hypothetical protein
VNAYNLEIARKRARTFIEHAIDLLTNHTVNPQYPGIVFALGGDMFCFPSGTPITDACGRVVPIEKVTPGMRVMGDPEDQIVVMVHERDPMPGEKLLRVRCTKLPEILATPEHVVAVLPREVVEPGWNPGGKRGVGFTVRDKTAASRRHIAWRPLSEIRPGDYLVFHPWRPTDGGTTFDLREITRLDLFNDGNRLLRKVRGWSPRVVSSPIIEATNNIVVPIWFIYKIRHA